RPRESPPTKTRAESPIHLRDAAADGTGFQPSLLHTGIPGALPQAGMGCAVGARTSAGLTQRRKDAKKSVSLCAFAPLRDPIIPRVHASKSSKFVSIFPASI